MMSVEAEEREPRDMRAASTDSDSYSGDPRLDGGAPRPLGETSTLSSIIWDEAPSTAFSESSLVFRCPFWVIEADGESYRRAL
jgi:hypothetical protein